MRTVFQHPPESLKVLKQVKKEYPSAFISGKEDFIDGADVITYTVYSVPYKGRYEELPKSLHQIHYKIK